MKFLLLIPIAIFISGCASSGVGVDNLSYSLYSIKKAVESSMPRGVRKVSENGRTYYSNYFLKVGGSLDNAIKMSRRKHAVVAVLGDSRPYKVTVQVVFEKRDSNKSAVVQTYDRVGYDNRLAKSLARSILKKLSKGREESNFIDDFRVF